MFEGKSRDRTRGDFSRSRWKISLCWPSSARCCPDTSFLREQPMNFQRLVAAMTHFGGFGSQQRRRRLCGVRRRDQRLAAFEPLEQRHLLAGTVSLVADITANGDSLISRLTESNGQVFF